MLTVDRDGKLEGVSRSTRANDRDFSLPTTVCRDERGTVVRCHAL